MSEALESTLAPWIQIVSGNPNNRERWIKTNWSKVGLDPKSFVRSSAVISFLASLINSVLVVWKIGLSKSASARQSLGGQARASFGECDRSMLRRSIVSLVLTSSEQPGSRANSAKVIIFLPMGLHLRIGNFCFTLLNDRIMICPIAY